MHDYMYSGHRQDIRRCAMPLLLLALAGLTPGCGARGQAPGRVSVAGRVTLDGRPLEYGSILFTGAGPRSGGVIRDGEFALEAAEGPLPGELTVEIRAPRLPSGTKLPEDPGERTKLVIHCDELLPARYNTQSTLRASASVEGPNQFVFELTGAP